ncbi:MAG: hypothetical protein R3B84_19380 [Zavarzinella sp.]
MTRYQCPECDEILKRATPLPEGKKVRCPKCDAVFVAKALAEKKASAPPPPPKKEAPKPEPVMAMADDDEEDSNPYTLKEEELGEKEKPDLFFGSLRDKFAKSQIGPAMSQTVKPSNWLMRIGLGTGVLSVIIMVLALFPVVFSEVDPIRPFLRPQVTKLLFGIFVFICASLMVWGASSMHAVSNLPMAIVGSVMGILVYVAQGIIAYNRVHQFGDGFERYIGYLGVAVIFASSLMGVWCLVVIFKPVVQTGFKEYQERAKDKRIV